MNVFASSLEFQSSIMYAAEASGIVIVLLLILFLLNFKNWTYRPINFLSVTYAIVLLCATSDLIWLFVDGKPEFALFNRIMQFAYIIAYPISAWTWLCHCLNQLNFKTKLLNTFKILGCILLFVSAGFVIASLWSDVKVIYVDDTGAYFRGDYFIIVPILTGINLLSATVLSIIGAFKTEFPIERKACITQALFMIPVVIAAIVQLALPPGIPVMFFGAGISLLLVYLNYQDDLITEDRVTNVVNHYTLDKKIGALIKTYKDGSYLDKELWMVIIDIDNFKKYNFDNGLVAGNKLLRLAADVIRQTAEPLKATVGRIGPDEFAILIESKDSLAPCAFIKALPRVLKDKLADTGENISFSYTSGYALYEKGMTRKEFVNKVSDVVYKNKLENKDLSKKPK
ncbi:MAG: diguanylate cyclase [Bacilli bacterium]|nr:diguanylate cyclase [Bacilli bacterium]